MSDELPGNSNKGKAPAPKKKVEKVTTNPVIQRKPTLRKRFAETFTGDDTKTVGSYVLFDVIIPAAKDMIADAISQGVERKLFGEVRSRSRRPGSSPMSYLGNSSYTAYHRYSSTKSPTREGSRGAPPRRPEPVRTAYDDIVLETRGEATEVLDTMYNIISQYDSVSVADLFDAVGISSEFTDEKWGWTDLHGADIRRVHEGYLLDLPRPQPLND